MKFLLILFATFTVAFTYSEIDESQDIELVVTDYQQLKAMYDCFLDRAPCNNFFQGFKDVLPDIAKTACAKCSASEKHMLKRMMQEIKKQAPEYFHAMDKKYDPDGIYVKPLIAAIIEY